jgi:uncharacterized membrane protein
MSSPELPLASHRTPHQERVESSHGGPAGARPHVHPVLLAAIAALIVGYALLCHYSDSTPGKRGLGAALSIGPIVLIGAVLLWRWTRPLIAIAVTVAAGAFIARYWDVFKENFEWADLVQQCGAYALVGVSFGRTLLSGRVPLCTRLAAELHGSLAPVEVAYTRRATLVWTGFYFSLAAAIPIVFFSAPLRVWSFFVNFATFGLMGLMCVADYAIRRHVLPRRPSEGLRAMIQRILIG